LKLKGYPAWNDGKCGEIFLLVAPKGRNILARGKTPGSTKERKIDKP
jgi:hypothetical protein